MADHRSRIGPYTASFRRQWRLFRTSAGSDVVNREMNALESDQAAMLVAEMRVIARRGLHEGGARHLRGAIWEVRAESDQATLRALFAKQGRYGQVLLVLHVFKKKTRETPPRLIALAEQRLRDWTIRGRPSHQRDN